jgi:hypothetical protein
MGTPDARAQDDLACARTHGTPLMNHRLLPCCLLFAATVATQTDATSPAFHVTDAVRAPTGWPFENVIQDQPGDTITFDRGPLTRRKETPCKPRQ